MSPASYRAAPPRVASTTVAHASEHLQIALARRPDRGDGSGRSRPLDPVDLAGGCAWAAARRRRGGLARSRAGRRRRVRVGGLGRAYLVVAVDRVGEGLQRLPVRLEVAGRLGRLEIGEGLVHGGDRVVERSGGGRRWITARRRWVAAGRRRAALAGRLLHKGLEARREVVGV